MLHRRDAMIRLGQVGLGSLTLPGLLAAGEQAASAKASAKACILVYLWGGPPQQDTFDMKPDAPDGIRSQFQPISTVVPGISICGFFWLRAFCPARCRQAFQDEFAARYSGRVPVAPRARPRRAAGRSSCASARML